MKPKDKNQYPIEENQSQKMTEYIIDKGNILDAINPDNIYIVIGNRLVSGKHRGFRRKEWAQDRTYLNKYNDY